MVRDRLRHSLSDTRRCRDLFSRDAVPFVSLHVDEKNKAARRAYEKVGFTEMGSYRLTLMAPAV